MATYTSIQLNITSTVIVWAFLEKDTEILPYHIIPLIGLKNCVFKPLNTGKKPWMGTLASSENPDEMQHCQSLHCLLRLKQSSVIEIHQNLENSTFNPFKNTMGSLVHIVSICLRKSSEYKALRWPEGAYSFDLTLKVFTHIKMMDFQLISLFNHIVS